MPVSAVDQLNVAGTFENLPAYARGYPNVGLQNFSNVGSPGNTPTTSNIPMWEYADSLSIVHGKQTFQTGFDYRTWVQKRNLSGNFLGSYDFSNNEISAEQQQGFRRAITSARLPPEFVGRAMRLRTFCWATILAPAPSSPDHLARCQGQIPAT